LRLRPKSIRTKLSLPFLIAVAAILSVQVMDAVCHVRWMDAQRDLFERVMAAPIDAADAEWAAAVAYMADGVGSEARRAKISLTLSALVGTAGLGIAFALGNRTVRSIRRLARGAKALAVGDYRRKIDIRTGDELESLAASFNALGESLLRHEQTQKEQAEMLAGMVEAARVASASLDARECAKAIARAVCVHFGASDAAMFRKEPLDGGLQVVGRSGQCGGADWKRLAAHSADSGGYLVVSEQHSSRADAAEALLVGVPLASGSETLGAIVARFDAGLSRDELAVGSLRADVLRAFGMHAAAAFANARLYCVEANIAQRLQMSLLSEAPERWGKLEFAGRYMPALDEAIVGGDFYDVTPLPNGRVAVAIADVSGKGLEAAMHLAACKYMLKALACAYPDDPARVLAELNNAINQCFHYDFFLTAFYAVIDPETREVTFANAGHPPALLVTENANMHTCLKSTGIPLGAGPACDYTAQSVTAKPGDVLLLYTDGVTDAVKGGIRLELEGLHSMVFEAGRCSGAELVDRLVEQLGRDSDPSRRDDMALLAVSFCSTADVSKGPPRSSVETPTAPSDVGG